MRPAQAEGLPHKTLFEYEKSKWHWVEDLPPPGA